MRPLACATGYRYFDTLPPDTLKSRHAFWDAGSPAGAPVSTRYPPAGPRPLDPPFVSAITSRQRGLKRNR